MSYLVQAMSPDRARAGVVRRSRPARQEPAMATEVRDDRRWPSTLPPDAAARGDDRGRPDLGERRPRAAGRILYKMVKKEIITSRSARPPSRSAGSCPTISTSARRSRCGMKRACPSPTSWWSSGRSSDYRPRPPSTSEVSLIVEVCHHTRKADYDDNTGSTRRPAFRLLDRRSAARRVEVFRGPVESGRRRLLRERHVPGDSKPVTILGRQIGQIAVATLLPPIS